MTFRPWRALMSKKQLALNNQFALAVIQNVVIMLTHSNFSILLESAPYWVFGAPESLLCIPMPMIWLHYEPHHSVLLI